MQLIFNKVIFLSLSNVLHVYLPYPKLVVIRLVVHCLFLFCSCTGTIPWELSSNIRHIRLDECSPKFISEVLCTLHNSQVQSIEVKEMRFWKDFSKTDYVYGKLLSSKNEKGNKYVHFTLKLDKCMLQICKIWLLYYVTTIIVHKL